jgi:hypothetical protein
MPRRLLFGLLIILAVGGLTAFCSRWKLHPANGRTCTVIKGQMVADVFAACGEPEEAGTQPKAFGSGGSFLNPQICSAPAYSYGTRAVLFGCDGTVATVQGVDGPGVVWAQPRMYADPGTEATRRQKARQPSVLPSRKGP